MRRNPTAVFGWHYLLGDCGQHEEHGGNEAQQQQDESSRARSVVVVRVNG
jgi:hypothetical protein